MRSQGSANEAVTAQPQVQPDSEEYDGWGSSLLQEVVTATYWFDPGSSGKPFSATIRFSGYRLGVTGKPEATDSFRQDETIHGIVPGSGPVSVTTTVRNISPGEWTVSAEPLLRKGANRVVRSYPWSHLGPRTVKPALSYWRKPAVVAGPAVPLKTAYLPFARVPGELPGAWPSLVGLGVALGVLLQTTLLARMHVDVRAGFAVLLLATIAGLAGAKIWFIAINPHSWRAEFPMGMCIQGFIVGAVVVLTAGLVILRMPIGAFLDAIVPGMFFGMAVGRHGCFFAGCCAGRPTASRWGLWASDRRVGARRIPTQLWESLVCLVIGSAALALVLQQRPSLHGAVFVGALAAYTLTRQVLLPLRFEPRKTSGGRWLVMGTAGLLLIADIVLSAID